MSTTVPNRVGLPDSASAQLVVSNFDNHGSLWGFSSIEETEALIVSERERGASIDEWETVDRDGQPLRVVRIADPSFLDTICVISTTPAVSPEVAR